MDMVMGVKAMVLVPRRDFKGSRGIRRSVESKATGPRQRALTAGLWAN
jgi:hypothetical protein